MKSYQEAIQDMDKKEYLIKTFSRTNRKDRENFVLNALWNRLDSKLRPNNINLMPVTQKYVRFVKSNRYALIDLYFPQLNIAVEVDEKHHDKRTKEDERREKEIKESIAEHNELSVDNINYLQVVDSKGIKEPTKLSAIDIDNSCNFYRIKTDDNCDYDDLIQRVNNVADEIIPITRDKYKTGKFENWDPKISSYEKAKNKGTLSINDFLPFENIAEACRCFNKIFEKGRPYGGGWFSGPGEYKNKCRFMFTEITYIMIDDQNINNKTINNLIKTTKKRWINVLSSDLTTLYEYSNKGGLPNLTDNLKLPRILFGRFDYDNNTHQKAFRFFRCI